MDSICLLALDVMTGNCTDTSFGSERNLLTKSVHQKKSSIPMIEINSIDLDLLISMHITHSFGSSRLPSGPEWLSRRDSESVIQN